MPLAQDEFAGRMRADLEATGGLVYTSAVLLELVEARRSREDAYAVAQAAAMETWQTGVPFRLGPVFERLAALA